MSSKTYSTLRETLGEATAFVVGSADVPVDDAGRRKPSGRPTPLRTVLPAKRNSRRLPPRCSRRHEELLRRLAQ